MKIRTGNISAIFFLVVALSCKKPFTPVIVTTNNSYLVVEGIINSNDSTYIKLSRTVTLTSPSSKNPESGAKVMIESDKNDQFVLTETIAGTYVTANHNLPADRNYRLHIFTSKNKEYVSDYVENKITPAIDSVYTSLLTNGIQFYVSTHDNSNKTRYYRWEYAETWSYNINNTLGEAPISLVVYRNNQIVPRYPDSLIDECYRNPVPSNNIFIANSSKLSQDIIYKYPLDYVVASSGKLLQTFSLLVKQYALTANAYTYWQLLKTNTEQLGSITDPQPSSSLTNLHAVTNPGETVIGYVSVSTVTSKRVFFSGRDSQYDLNQLANDTVKCSGGEILTDPANTFQDRLNKILASGDSLLIAPVYSSGINARIIGYTYSTAICLDCRLRGGTTTKPPYWPQ